MPRLLCSAGLIEVQSDAFFPMGGPACSLLGIHMLLGLALVVLAVWITVVLSGAATVTG